MKIKIKQNKTVEKVIDIIFPYYFKIINKHFSDCNEYVIEYGIIEKKQFTHLIMCKDKKTRKITSIEFSVNEIKNVSAYRNTYSWALNKSSKKTTMREFNKAKKEALDFLANDI